MKNINYFVIALFSISILLSCKKENKTEIVAPVKIYDQLTKASWFLGEWENQTKEAYFHEKWVQKNDSSFIGKSYVLIGKDTVFNEKMLLEQRKDSLFCIISEKNEKPVSFYLSESSPNQLVFENPKHDFPNKIVYNSITKDSIFAEISGKQEGKEVKEAFPMRKKK